MGVTFMLQIDSPIQVKLSKEHSEFKWITKDEINEIEMHPGLRKDLLKVFEFVES